MFSGTASAAVGATHSRSRVAVAAAMAIATMSTPGGPKVRAVVQERARAGRRRPGGTGSGRRPVSWGERLSLTGAAIRFSKIGLFLETPVVCTLELLPGASGHCLLWLRAFFERVGKLTGSAGFLIVQRHLPTNPQARLGWLDMWCKISMAESLVRACPPHRLWRARATTIRHRPYFDLCGGLEGEDLSGQTHSQVTF